MKWKRNKRRIRRCEAQWKGCCLILFEYLKIPFRICIGKNFFIYSKNSSEKGWKIVKLTLGLKGHEDVYDKTFCGLIWIFMTLLINVLEINSWDFPLNIFTIIELVEIFCSIMQSFNNTIVDFQGLKLQKLIHDWAFNSCQNWIFRKCFRTLEFKDLLKENR